MVETDLLLVSVIAPFVHDVVSFTERAAIGLRARGGGGAGICAYTYFCLKLSGLFPFLYQQMHEKPFIFSADQEKLPVRTRFAFGRCRPLQPLPLAGGTRRRVVVVAHVQKNRISII